jgi:protein TonB
MVGVVSVHKERGVGSPAKAPPKEAVKTKETARPKKNIVKKTVKKKRERVEAKNEVISRDEEAGHQELAVASGQRTESHTIELPPGVGNGSEGLSKGVDIGYPDYQLNPKPNYPMIARRNGYEGVVLLSVFVLENGRVGRIQLEQSSGHDMLDKSALETVKDWIFVPGKRDGVPYASWVTVPIRFQLTSG